MKMDKKTAYLIAGAIFLIRAVYSLYSIIMSQAYLYIPMVLLILQAFGIALGIALGVTALRGKDRGLVLNILAYVHFFIIASNLITAGFKALPTTIIWLAVAIFAFVISNGKNTLLSTKDTVSEAAKQQIQTEKQTTIYDEQLRDGIITQEEYDQIMASKKD